VELLLGCGSSRAIRFPWNGREKWTQLVTLDWNADHKPDVVHDLESLPYPFADDTFDEVHAYEVLEHLGRLGDFRSFLAQFSELWRILKPGGHLAATCPSYRSMWAFGDPSHTRVLNEGSLVFLSQRQYREQVGKTAMSDFRFCYSADFKPATYRGSDGKVYPFVMDDGESFHFVLEAIKPAS
jgi:SAM-dependent methyltransferase